MVEALLADDKCPPDLFFVVVIGNDTHRLFLCDLREVADECSPFHHLLRRAVAGEDRVLVEREECLERCAPERVELHPELFEELDGYAGVVPFMGGLSPGACRFAADKIDGLDHTGIKELLDPDRNLERRPHPALVFADRAPGHPEHLSEVAKRHVAPLAELPQGVAVDVHVQPAGRRVDKRGDLLDKIIVQRRDADRIDAVPDIDRPPFEFGFAGAFTHDQGHCTQMPGDHIEIERSFLAYRIDMSHDFYHEQSPVVACDEVETPRAENKLLGYLEPRRDHHAGYQLELAFLGHAVTNGWSVPIY